MRSFLQFLLSEKLEDFKPSELGFSNSLDDLPEICPYGFWVDKHGNFIKVSYQNHETVGSRILYKAEEPIVKGIYGMLFDRGWCRVVTEDDLLSYEVTPGGQLSNSQAKVIKYMAQFYGIPEIENDTPGRR